MSGHRLHLVRFRNMSMFFVSVTVFICSVLRWQNTLMCTLFICTRDVYIQYSSSIDSKRKSSSSSSASVWAAASWTAKMHDRHLLTRTDYYHQLTATKFDIPVRIAISPAVEQRCSPPMCAVSGQFISQPSYNHIARAIWRSAAFNNTAPERQLNVKLQK